MEYAAMIVDSLKGHNVFRENTARTAQTQIALAHRKNEHIN